MSELANINAMNRSLTGVYELSCQASILSGHGDLIGERKIRERILQIRVFHLNVAPYSSSLDVADCHITVAKVIVKIISKLGGSDNALTFKYEAQLADHYHAAYVIHRDIFG